MSNPGSLVEVLTQSRGSQVVGDHLSGATVLLVDDPTPFGDADGQVFVDGNSYTYTAVTEIPDTTDPSTTNGQLALTSGLAASVADLTPVEVWNGSQVLDDAILMVSVGVEGDPPIPVTLTAEQRVFWEGRLGPVDPPVAVSLSDDLTMLLDAPGWTPSVNGAAIVGFPDPAAVAVDPPAASPAIATVQGNATGLTVVTAPILPTTLLDFYVNGVLVATNQRTTVINLTTDGTNALAIDTDYTVTVQAHNAATDADPTHLPAISAGVTARLDPGVTATEVTAILQAGFILAGSIQVGSSMTLDGVGGITVTQTDGRQTYMRADGSGNQFVGQATLDAATILGALTILGQTNNLNGLLTLGSGVSDPTAKPGVAAAGWDSVTQSSGAIYGFNPRGLFDNGSTWVYTDSASYSGNVNSIDKTTGARGLLSNLPANFAGVGGVVKVGTNWYVLGVDGSRSGNWYVYVFNSSWVKTGEWAPNGVSGDSLAIGVDGTGLLIAKRTVGGNLYVSNYTTVGVESSFVLCGMWTGETMVGVVKAAVDTATVRFVVASPSGIRVFNTGTGTRVNSEEWTPAANPLGISTNGSNWATLSNSRVWKYTNLIGTWDFAFTWVDNDAAGAGVAETKRSAKLATAPTKRAKWTISLPSAPPDDGTTDGANTANLYAVATGGTLVLQTALAEGTFSATYSTLATAGTAPPSTSGFAARPGSIGRLASTAQDTSSNPIVDIRGDGAGRLGPLTWDATGAGISPRGGIIAVPVTASATGTANVTFSPAFNNAPIVQLTVVGSTSYLTHTTVTPTTTGMTVGVRHWQGTATTVTINVHWTAREP